MTNQEIKATIKSDTFREELQAMLDAANVRLSEFNKSQQEKIIKSYAVALLNEKVSA